MDLVANPSTISGNTDNKEPSMTMININDEVEITDLIGEDHQKDEDLLELLEKIIQYLKAKRIQAVCDRDRQKLKKILAKLYVILKICKDGCTDDYQTSDEDTNVTSYLMKLNGAGGVGIVAAHHLNSYVLQIPTDFLFRISAIATVTGFVACLISLRLLKRSKMASKILGKVGSVATVVAFVCLASPYLDNKLMWVLIIGAIAAIVSLLLC